MTPWIWTKRLFVLRLGDRKENTGNERQKCFSIEFNHRFNFDRDCQDIVPYNNINSQLSYFGLFSSSGVVGSRGLFSAWGEGELGLSLSPEKSAVSKSGRFLPPPCALRAHERSVTSNIIRHSNTNWTIGFITNNKSI